MRQLIDRRDAALSGKSRRSLPLTCRYGHPASTASAFSRSDPLGTQPAPRACLNMN